MQRKKKKKKRKKGKEGEEIENSVKLSYLFGGKGRYRAYAIRAKRVCGEQGRLGC